MFCSFFFFIERKNSSFVARLLVLFLALVDTHRGRVQYRSYPHGALGFLSRVLWAVH